MQFYCGAYLEHYLDGAGIDVECALALRFYMLLADECDCCLCATLHYGCYLLGLFAIWQKTKDVLHYMVIHIIESVGTQQDAVGPTTS